MPNPTHNEIADRARLLWEQAGGPADRDQEFWLQAEAQLKAGGPDRAPEAAAPSPKLLRPGDKPDSPVRSESIPAKTGGKSASSSQREKKKE